MFAIRPELGRRYRAYIRSEQSAESVETVWYKCVRPPQASDVFDVPHLAPIDLMEYHDGKHFKLVMQYRAAPEAGFGWIVNSAGEIVSVEKGDAYNRNSDLPRLDTFDLRPLRPIRVDAIPDQVGPGCAPIW